MTETKDKVVTLVFRLIVGRRDSYLRNYNARDMKLYREMYNAALGSTDQDYYIAFRKSIEDAYDFFIYRGLGMSAFYEVVKDYKVCVCRMKGDRYLPYSILTSLNRNVDTLESLGLRLEALEEIV